MNKYKKSSKVRQDRRNLISVLAYLLSASAESYLYRGDWTLGCVPMQFWDFANISLFPKILSLKSFDILWGNSNIMFQILDIKLRFTCGAWNLYWHFQMKNDYAKGCSEACQYNNSYYFFSSKYTCNANGFRYGFRYLILELLRYLLKKRKYTRSSSKIGKKILI